MKTEEPTLVVWEPRWTPPTIEATCPSCGARRPRIATSWRGRVDGTLTAVLVCERGVPDAERSCWRNFNVTVDIEERTDQPFDLGGDRS
jgi:hypothetical protein